MSPVWAVGLMTGTVLDGMIDIAAIRTDGEQIHELGPWRLAPYSRALRTLLSDALDAAREWRFAGPEPAVFAEAERALTRAQTGAVQEFLSTQGFSPGEVAVIGFHGQTVLHRPPDAGRPGDTRQLGDGASMAQATGIDVVYDFRTTDVRSGGQGAPLAAVYHAALLRHLGAAANSAVLNLGGVANVTWWGGGDRVIAFDTGPANAPLNDWVRHHGLGDVDRDGALARQGVADETRLARLIEDPYFAAPYPKSLDRNSFPAAIAAGLSAADGAATLTAFIGAAVGKALDRLPRRPDTVVVCGGGRKNPAVVEAIRARARVVPILAEEVGWRGDAIEAECFAYLAVRAARGLPISFPLTTGVKHPMTGGRLAKPTPSSRRG
ncbi:MAG TPA: anhydro-N-acetylmuramic acid kinase [Steroidobacteraceae bacterium]|nr:anhydro-N-acetylmuramic acid kinase [Steroidobacteraceae bacterium]